MSEPLSGAGEDTIKVGVIADQTGPLSFVGLANANVARMVIGDINARGGLLGRHLELVLEDGATDDAVAAAKGEKLVQTDRVAVVFGGIFSSTRQAIKQPVVVEGKTLYIYPEQYEGRESDPLIFCTGPVPSQQVDPFIPWLMRETGSGTRLLVSEFLADHDLRPQTLTLGSNGAIREAVRLGLGVSLASRVSVEHELKAGTLAEIRVRGGLPRREWFALHSATVPPRPAVEQFLAFAFGPEARAAFEGRE